jgi:hypothetical protein
LKNSSQSCCFLFLISLIMTGSGLPQTRPETSAAMLAALPDAPQAQQPAQQFAPRAQQMTLAPFPPPRKYAQVIEPEQTADPFNAVDKLVFSVTEIARPVTLLPALYSASYEQLFLTDPKYGHDAGAFGEKFGAAMLRSASVRVFSDGILAAAFHQDPRYYRIAKAASFVADCSPPSRRLFAAGTMETTNSIIPGSPGARPLPPWSLLTILNPVSPQELSG